MKQSTYIIEQCLHKLTDLRKFKLADFSASNSGLKVISNKKKIKTSMENLIHHFKIYSKGFIVPKNLCYTSVEAPKGEFGSFIMSNNTFKPFRNKIRAPGFFHLQGLDFMSKDHFLADIVTIIGTLDIVFGEIDR